MTIQKKIIKFVERNSFQTFEGDEHTNVLEFTTRENGDVGAEEFSPIDFKDAQDIAVKLISEFGGAIVEYNIEPCDEWVNLEVTLKD